MDQAWLFICKRKKDFTVVDNGSCSQTFPNPSLGLLSACPIYALSCAAVKESDKSDGFESEAESNGGKMAASSEKKTMKFWKPGLIL